MAGDDKTVRLHIVVDEDTKGAKRTEKALGDTTKASDKLGHSFKSTARNAAELDQELKDLYTKRADIIRRYRETDDKDLLKERSSVNRRIGLLRAMRKELVEAPGNAGGDLLDFGGQGIRPRNAAIGGLVGLGVLLAPAIGAAIEGVLAGGVVAAGLAGGIAMASKDPEVRTAAQQFGSAVSQEFFGNENAKAFSDPIKVSLKELENSLESADLGAAFAKGAPALVMFARGVGDLVENMMPGFNDIMDRSEAIGEIFEDGLGNIGDALGDFMTDIAESEGTLDGLKFALDLVAGTIRGTGTVLEALGDIFHHLNIKGAEFTGILEDIPIVNFITNAKDANDNFEDWGNTGEAVVSMMGRFNREADASGEAYNRLTASEGNAQLAANKAGEAHRVFAGYLASTKREAGEATDALTDLFNIELSASQAADDWEAALDDLAESVKENGTSLDAGTEKGRANRDMLRDGVRAALDMREANIKNGMSQQDANEIYAAQITKLEALAIKLGLAKDKVLGLVGEYEIVIMTTYKTQGHKPTYNPGSSSVASQEVYGARASGGPVVAGVPYTINELGRETVTFPANGMVHPASLSPAGGGSASVNINLSFGMGTDLREAGRQTVLAIQEYERRNGRGWRS